MKDFTALRAVHQLQDLAKRPYDLTSDNALTVQRLETFKTSMCGFDLLYATQRVDENILKALQELADEAGLVEALAAMQTGAVLNRIEGYASEDRQVLHTACRDIFTESPMAGDASAKAQRELAKLQSFLDELADGTVVNQAGQPFSTMVQVGIGGSDLGPRAICLALKAYSLPGRSAQFIANVDPDDAAEVLQELDLSTTLFNIVSKSGTTLETLTNEQLIRDSLIKAGLDPAHHVLAVTGEGSPMDDPSRYLRSFYMEDYIGGRYSATSMVGVVTLGFVLGFAAVMEFLKGAHEVDRAALQPAVRSNIPLLLALLGIWNHNFLGYPTVAILPYSQALSRFPAHLQQCDMESNGKSVTRQGREVAWKTGPVVWGEPGTNGQHAFYQLIHQGTEVVPVEFIGFRQSRYGVDVMIEGTSSQQKLVANMLAQSLALAMGKDDENPARRFQGNRPNSVLLADRLTPRSMGSLLAMYEHKIAFQGFCWHINSFDQEGVQLGKVLAQQLLSILTQPDNQYGEEVLGKQMLRIAGLY
ncbi:glucose-6-phosphate isomerase [Desulfobulbus oligotrophicus]|uniref:Glucose-6-phosphate isomerase n=1 Tax=Desulfobulbus oligotrophicus TaxID=1909699 RepID=A0A7T5VCT4_9BACT|nr:glucose-6-phosphate isomerase [Desulfobulbus oligotrophicus]QQG65519.1 glucose-6-phosphate isomerase [Desulfobulbus oligotrophicus]